MPRSVQWLLYQRQFYYEETGVTLVALLSHTGGRHGLQDVKQQIEHNKQDTDEQNVSLDHGIIPVENGTDAQGSQSRPCKYIFHYNGS